MATPAGAAAAPEPRAVILVDTSVWIDHFRRANAMLAAALLETLPSLTPSTHDEVMAFVNRHDLVGSGLGWVDVHVLCAARRERWSL
jgi:predicted nucleic acid-binding protein